MSTHTRTFGRRVHWPRHRAAWIAAAMLAVAALALLGRGLVGSQAPPARPELQRVLDRLVARPAGVAPGATAFVSGPHGVWVGSAGVADARTGAPMPVDARMRLESVSKIYTAAVIVQLAQQGRLRLDDTVERWLPGMLPYGDRITVRELLTMRSGLIDNNDIAHAPARFLARVGDPVLRARLADLVRRFGTPSASRVAPIWWIRWAAALPLLSRPGTRAHYSNIGYEVLGLVAARAGGAPLATLYRTHIFGPLGLRATAYDPQGPIAGPHAHGYLLATRGRRLDTTAVHAGIAASGGIVADARDTGTFLTGLMDGRLLRPAFVRALRGGALWLGGEPSGCAGPAFGWSGGGYGYKTNVWVSADGTRVAVLLLNARMADAAQPVADGIAAGALARLYCAA